jgi:hypothetical protein
MCNCYATLQSGVKNLLDRQERAGHVGRCMTPLFAFAGKAATLPRIVAILVGYACVRIAWDLCNLILWLIGR